MNEDPRLGNLLAYTTFHMGVYISLITAIIGAGVFLGDDSSWYLRYSTGCILIAGFYGGVIGSNLAEATSYESLLEQGKLEIFPCRLKIAKLETCIRFEHGFFWLGVLPPSVTFIVFGPSAFK